MSYITDFSTLGANSVSFFSHTFTKHTFFVIIFFCIGVLTNFWSGLWPRMITKNDHQKRLTIDYFPQYSIRNNEWLFEDNHNFVTILLFTKTNRGGTILTITMYEVRSTNIVCINKIIVESFCIRFLRIDS
jgi:hypothetical protein